MRFTSDNQHIVTAGLDKQVFVWSLRAGGGGTGGSGGGAGGGASGVRHMLTEHADYVLDLLVFRAPSAPLSTSNVPTVVTVAGFSATSTT